MPTNDYARTAKVSHGWTQMNTDETAKARMFFPFCLHKAEVSDSLKSSVSICVHLWPPVFPEVTP